MPMCQPLLIINYRCFSLVVTMDANRDEGKRCLQLAKQAFDEFKRKAPFYKALRLAEKAARLNPDDDAQQFLDRLKRESIYQGDHGGIKSKSASLTRPQGNKMKTKSSREPCNSVINLKTGHGYISPPTFFRGQKLLATKKSY